jgi:hypothetical protein
MNARTPAQILLALYALAACGDASVADPYDDVANVVAIEQPGTASAGGNPARAPVRFISESPPEADRLLLALPVLHLDSVDVLLKSDGSCESPQVFNIPIAASVPFDGAQRLSLLRARLCAVVLRGSGDVPLLGTAVTLPGGRVVPLAFGRQRDALIEFIEPELRTDETGLFVVAQPLRFLDGLDAESALINADGEGLNDTNTELVASNLPRAIEIFDDTNGDGLLESSERTAVAVISPIARP